MSNLKIFTLNIWGLPNPVVCKLRRERVFALGTELAKGEFDIVLLQEVWLKSDYNALVEKICPVMPYTYYFYSGLNGSGLCVFSKGPIVETQFFPFVLNGYAHKVHHGDWYNGKGIGLCKIEYSGLVINMFTTHLIAEYCQEDDEYLAHRIAQSFQLSQIVKLTSGSRCDIVIVAGDMNMTPVVN